MVSSAEQSTGTTELQTKTFPGAFGASPESTRLAKQLEALLGQGFDSPFKGALEGALGNVGLSTPEELATADFITEGVHGQAAARGLGPATTGAQAQGLAPFLLENQQQKINAAQEAFLNDLGSQAALKGIDAEALTELIGFAMPQTIAGQRGKSKGTEVGSSGAFYSGIGGGTPTSTKTIAT